MQLSLNLPRESAEMPAYVRKFSKLASYQSNICVAAIYIESVKLAFSEGTNKIDLVQVYKAGKIISLKLDQ